MKIGNFDTDQKVLVVAEIGNNHEGSYTLAEEMIGLAAEAGAGAVKFQTITPDQLVSAGQTNRICQLKKYCLSHEQFERLVRVAKLEDIIFLSTPFDIETVRFLNGLVPAFKVSSGDNNHFPLIEEIAITGKPIILSAGMSNMKSIRCTCDFIQNIWKQSRIAQDMAVLHCVSAYPTPHEEANLLSIKTLLELGVTVGYSDHTLGIKAPVLAVALGARIIEKHFTIDKHYSDFRDHQLSADPKEFALLVNRIREAEILLGTTEKRIYNCEKEGNILFRRSVAAASDLSAGTRIEKEHIIWVRPGVGLSPGKEKMLLGKKLKRSLKNGEMILPEDVE